MENKVNLIAALQQQIHGDSVLKLAPCKGIDTASITGEIYSKDVRGFIESSNKPLKEDFYFLNKEKYSIMKWYRMHLRRCRNGKITSDVKETTHVVSIYKVKDNNPWHLVETKNSFYLVFTS